MLPLHLSFVFGLALGTPLVRAAEELNDAKILNSVISANIEEVTLGRLALKRATNPSVQAFAKDMVRDHSASLQKAQKLAVKLQIKPQSSRGSEEMSENALKQNESLSSRTGPDFDREYVGERTEGHRKLLEKIDKDLLAHAKNAQLRAFLQDTRATVQAHLTHAQEAQAQMR